MTRPVLPEFEAGLVDLRSVLTAIAVKYTRNPDRAQDLVQDTYCRALQYRDSFQVGTNLAAWLTTLMRSVFIKGFQRHRGLVFETDEALELLSVPAAQEHVLAVADLAKAFGRLPADQQQAVNLLVIDDMPYAEAASIAGAPVGTMKSRVNRARERLRLEVA